MALSAPRRQPVSRSRVLPELRGRLLNPAVPTFLFRLGAPALRAAGVPHRRLYDCRHTFATWAIESGIELWYLARVMGTSTAQIEDTYARWLKRTDDQLRAVFDAYDASLAVSSATS
jgi:integrase